MKHVGVRRRVAHAALFILFSVGVAAPASAHSTGMSGASGKTNGFYCRGCHAGGIVPTIAFDGPTTMEPGAIATFRFTVTSQAKDSQTAGGLDVAGSGGILGLVADQGTQLLHSEVTHTGPKDNDANGQAPFDFTWQAPATPGTYTLYGAGCSVNDNSKQTGDAAAKTTYDVVVVPCIGNCDETGEVTVDELITGVNIALGITPPAACPALGGNVTIDEIIQAVNNMLTGCSPP